jgi:hypothetical protein
MRSSIRNTLSLLGAASFIVAGCSSSGAGATGTEENITAPSTTAELKVSRTSCNTPRRPPGPSTCEPTIHELEDLAVLITGGGPTRITIGAGLAAITADVQPDGTFEASEFHFLTLSGDSWTELAANDTTHSRDRSIQKSVRGILGADRLTIGAYEWSDTGLTIPSWSLAGFTSSTTTSLDAEAAVPLPR